MSADTGTRLLVVRHGETDWNAQRRVQGHTDIALNDTGKRQASLLARALADSPIHHVYSSDLQRARHTAQALAGPHDAARLGCDPEVVQVLEIHLFDLHSLRKNRNKKVKNTNLREAYKTLQFESS